MTFDVAPLPVVPEGLTLLIWLGAVAGLIVLILIGYFSYKYIKQKKLEKLMPEDLEKKNKKSEKEEAKEEVIEECKAENTDIEGK